MIIRHNYTFDMGTHVIVGNYKYAANVRDRNHKIKPKLICLKCYDYFSHEIYTHILFCAHLFAVTVSIAFMFTFVISFISNHL